MLLTASDVSRRAGGRVTPHTVRHAADRGEIACIRTAGNVRLFDAVAVDEWLQRRGLLEATAAR
jgi:hypothetical protein